MSGSLDDAIRANAEWEQQKKQIDTRWAKRLCDGQQQAAKPAVPFDTQVSDYLKGHETAIRKYAAAIIDGACGPTDCQLMTTRASHLELMLDQLASNPKRFFERKHDKVFTEELKESASSNSPYYSADFGNRLREAAVQLSAIASAYMEQHGPLL